MRASVSMPNKTCVVDATECRSERENDKCNRERWYNRDWHGESEQASISMLNRLGVGETERVVDAMRPTSVSIRASIAANEHVVGTIESVAVQTSAWI